MEEARWHAGFELELILGNLGDERFTEYTESMGPMDTATPAFCRAVAKHLSRYTGVKWRAPVRTIQRPGFCVVPEYDLDPLDWPRDRCAGVELLTPPLSIEEAESLRVKVADTILDLDFGFDPFPGDLMDQCAWHINIDAGKMRLDPTKFILANFEMPILKANRRLCTPYTSIQRHSFGVSLLRHLEIDPDCLLLANTGLNNLLRARAGRSKTYAANFSKLMNGYVELRHFSASSFFEETPLSDILDPITSAFEMSFSQMRPLEAKLLAQFRVLSEWLTRFRPQIECGVKESAVFAAGDVSFAGQRAGCLAFNGTADLALFGEGEELIAEIRNLDLTDVDEGVALLALDLVETSQLGLQIKLENHAFSSAIEDLREDLAVLLPPGEDEANLFQ